MKVELTSKGSVKFSCPGCKTWHDIPTQHSDNNTKWDFNDDYNNPTIFPSILAQGYSYPLKSDYICHSFVEKGKIRFLQDCTHPLKGQTVELPDIKKD
ncbi:MAG: DUF6527 family protein [Novosphingobium sp.]|nr:DUF6527 family protein [Novosphingobium sp.]